jgi:pteridine reductase
MPPTRRRAPLPLSGAVALVTGGSKRIGRATVLALADAGANVVIHANRSRTDAEALAQVLRRRGRRAAVVVGDLADPAQCEKVVPAAIAALGRLDVLVNNAAVFASTPADAPDPAAFDEHMAVNGRAVYLLTGAAAKWMARHGGGNVVNVACASASSAWPGYIPYSASKAATVAVTQGFAKAFAPRVRVNAVAPGPILRAIGSTAARNRAALAATLLRRWGSAEDIAQAIVYLATAPFVTGTVLPVDGGRHLR